MEKEFFNELQKHSQAKLKILNDYVIPWMRKIVLGTMAFGGKCLVIDGFAGKGKYDENGADGSPLILLKNAIDFCEQAKRNKWKEPNINLIFIEGDKDNYTSLQHNIESVIGIKAESDLKGKFFFHSDAYPSIKIACVNDEFKNVIETLLDSVPNLIPSFCFIDPFGFSQTPFHLIQRFMKNDRAEILLNFIYEETNRFIFHRNEAIQAHISSHFGINEIDELRSLLHPGLSAGMRKQIIVEFYSQQLYHQAGAKHVLNFEIKKSGRTKLILFFATKSRDGLSVMKQAMWGQDDTGAYLFDDKKSTQQIQFEFIAEILETKHIDDLSEEIFEEFRGRENITKERVEDFVLVSTIYPLGKLVTAALKKLEASGKIVGVKKIQLGTHRRPNTYKDVYIEFAK